MTQILTVHYPATSLEMTSQMNFGDEAPKTHHAKHRNLSKLIELKGLLSSNCHTQTKYQESIRAFLSKFKKNT